MQKKSIFIRRGFHRSNFRYRKRKIDEIFVKHAEHQYTISLFFVKEFDILQSLNIKYTELIHGLRQYSLCLNKIKDNTQYYCYFILDNPLLSFYHKLLE